MRIARVGTVTYSIARQYVDRVLLVTDDQIRAAQRSLWEHFRVAAEPGGAAAFAALLSGQYRPNAGEHVVVVVCGGNMEGVFQ